MFFGFLGTCSFCDRNLFVRFEYGGGDTENRVQLEGLDELIYFICLVGLTAYGVTVRAISTISLHRYLSVKTRTLLSKHNIFSSIQDAMMKLIGSSTATATSGSIFLIGIISHL